MPTQMGGWPAPFGITIVFDGISGALLVTTQLVALAALIYASGSLSPLTERRWFHPLAHLLVMGVNYSFLTGDLFNLFVAFEVMLMSSYALLCAGGSRRQMTQAYKYVMLNLIASGFFVLGAGLVYGMMGTLNYADLARVVAASGAPGGEPLPAAFPAVATMLLFVFALKAAVFPLWFWLPDTYHTTPIPVAALFGGLLTKVGVYAMLRLMPMVFAAPAVRDETPLVLILTVAAGTTMVLGALCALAMRSVRRVIAMLLVSHIGFPLMGIALMAPAALAGALFYSVQSMLTVAAMFICCGIVERLTGTDDMDRLGGLHRRAPWLSALFLIAAMSTVGLPPLSGFYGKLAILQTALDPELEAAFGGAAGHVWTILSVALIVTSALTLIVLAKVYARVFWVSPEGEVATQSRLAFPGRTSGLRAAYVSAALLVSASVGVGLAPEPLLSTTAAATAELNEPRGYVTAVLGDEAWTEDGPARTLAIYEALAEVEPGKKGAH
jgi:multicomponent Na+:H+ antiporter subunit D